ncbi:MAG TPA: hypothetical protein VMU42_02380 [Candidatus Sulfotelmatobacter sp.]|nr:hypothetical protein [Candidatus Sulfotelmatobacter sp.]
MPGPQEIFRSIFGAWRLAHLDPSGMFYFNLTIEGFYRSFLAPIFAAPFFVLLVLLQIDPKTDAAPVLEVEIIAYLVTWIAYPALMILLCRVLDLGQHYVAFIVAYNWSQIVVIAVYLPLNAVIGYRLLGGDVSAILSVLGLAASCFYLWFIARTALQTTALVAIGLTVAEILVELIVHRGVELLV